MEDTDRGAMRRDQVLWMVTGLLIGLALSLALDSVAFMAIGVGLGVAFQEQAKRDARKRHAGGQDQPA
ncbi:hypothetical protein [Euzebya sp.]|uniref:hypothetical protein n=1 Tax=Euzebya sp. TaxID=1971409 RepID=UPI00351411AE